MNQDFAAQLEKSLHEWLPLVKALDIRIEEARPGFVKVSMSRSQIHVNHFGAFHAGALYTFAETAAGAAVTATFNLDGYTLINKRGEIKYRKVVTQKAESDLSFALEEMERIMAEGAEKGKTEFQYPVIVKNEKGEVACEVTFDFFIRKNKE